MDQIFFKLLHAKRNLLDKKKEKNETSLNLSLCIFFHTVVHEEFNLEATEVKTGAN